MKGVGRSGVAETKQQIRLDKSQKRIKMIEKRNERQTQINEMKEPMEKSDFFTVSISNAKNGELIL